MTSPSYQCAFTADGWKTDDWLQVRGPRWDHPGGWEQQPDHISNCVPEGATAIEMNGPRAGEVYSSMILARPPVPDLLVRTTTSFDYRMAPLIVLAGPLGEDKDGHPEYREHIEVVIYDLGVNVWHHVWVDETPAWHRAGWCDFSLEAGVRHSVEVEKTGRLLTVGVNEHRFGCHLTGFDPDVQAGITACEGINRFYDFEVQIPQD
jgi:hypothetical protein